MIPLILLLNKIFNDLAGCARFVVRLELVVVVGGLIEQRGFLRGGEEEEGRQKGKKTEKTSF